MGLKVSPLTRIISLSGFLALGFLLVILSCALFHNYYPLFDILIFLIAPIPNALFSKRNFDSSEFMNDSSKNVEDVGHFFTGLLVTSGLALPTVFYHCQIINHYSCIMSTIGGVIIYMSIVVFSWFFNSGWDEEDDALFGY
ncbi:LAQU0S04e10330g1_1 [Lachancea quebecensis]|uniref:LAQU0S04e10330g1_1 n=1 Tax=Lachancea quebecensis TaxID=1654605 RepID=A0A0P1KR66_9SACH|nr:LAQU0S04e10330g1_1 [Lachancea quebecensis]